jgi:D-alanyl-D-alanine carboxypeptidase
MRYTGRVSKRAIWIISVVIVVAAGLAYWKLGNSSPQASVQTKKQSTTTTSTKPVDTFSKTQFSTTDPNSLWIIVNKQHPLQPITYAPSDLRYPNVTLRVPGQTEMQMRDPAATALEKMFVGAEAAGYKLQVSTAYRGYSYQKTLYDGYVASAGQTAADQESARPGYSEHQTGLAVDIRAQSDKCSLEACFGTMPEGDWLATNAYKYGFLLRYPADKVKVTGYEYEPWHFRYIGTDLSQELHKQNIQTLEEFFGVTGGETYK